MMVHCCALTLLPGAVRVGVAGASDKTLIFLELCVGQFMKRFEGCKTKAEAYKMVHALAQEPLLLPGDPGFALGGFLQAPTSKSEAGESSLSLSPHDSNALVLYGKTVERIAHGVPTLADFGPIFPTLSDRERTSSWHRREPHSTARCTFVCTLRRLLCGLLTGGPHARDGASQRAGRRTSSRRGRSWGCGCWRSATRRTRVCTTSTGWPSPTVNSSISSSKDGALGLLVPGTFPAPVGPAPKHGSTRYELNVAR
jgi:hypothetical protein